jgi:hypothetical protein
LAARSVLPEPIKGYHNHWTRNVRQVTALSMTRIGSTTFTTDNTGVRPQYEDGVLVRAIIGGLISGSDGIRGRTEDFIVGSDNSPTLGGAPFAEAVASTTATGAIGFSIAPSSGQITGAAVAAVPEPSMMISAATGVLMLAGYAWRRRRRAAA